jgi:hypothetical protein
MDQTLEPTTQLFLNLFPQPGFLWILTVYADLLNGLFSFFGLNLGVVAV